jgi:predicted membrane-bound spermidine synthase
MRSPDWVLAQSQIVSAHVLSTATGFDTVKSRAEVKFLAASFALLVGLVVPVSAAVMDTTNAVAAEASTGLAATTASFLVPGAPPPLLVMAVGALVVLIPVTRRALRAGLPVERARN